MNQNPTPSTTVSEAVQIQRDYYTRTAEHYDEMHLVDQEHYRALEWTTDLMRRYQLESVLDVGCGTGRGVKYFLDRGFDPVGIEPVQALLDSGCQSYGLPHERMQLGSGEQLPFADRQFEVSIEMGVLHHVPRPEKVVREMLRVTSRLVCISDSNRFGQGRFAARLIKYAAWHCGLWPMIDLIRTRGKGYTISEEDGLAYSYSVYDSYYQLAEWADHIYAIPTSAMTSRSWSNPLLTSSHVLLVAERNAGR